MSQQVLRDSLLLENIFATGRFEEEELSSFALVSKAFCEGASRALYRRVDSELWSMLLGPTVPYVESDRRELYRDSVRVVSFATENALYSALPMYSTSLRHGVTALEMYQVHESTSPVAQGAWRSVRNLRVDLTRRVTEDRIEVFLVQPEPGADWRIFVPELRSLHYPAHFTIRRILVPTIHPRGPGPRAVVPTVPLGFFSISVCGLAAFRTDEAEHPIKTRATNDLENRGMILPALDIRSVNLSSHDFQRFASIPGVSRLSINVPLDVSVQTVINVLKFKRPYPSEISLAVRSDDPRLPYCLKSPLDFENLPDILRSCANTPWIKTVRISMPFLHSRLHEFEAASNYARNQHRGRQSSTSSVTTWFITILQPARKAPTSKRELDRFNSVIKFHLSDLARVSRVKDLKWKFATWTN